MVRKQGFYPVVITGYNDQTPSNNPLSNDDPKISGYNIRTYHYKQPNYPSAANYNPNPGFARLIRQHHYVVPSIPLGPIYPYRVFIPNYSSFNRQPPVIVQERNFHNPTGFNQMIPNDGNKNPESNANNAHQTIPVDNNQKPNNNNLSDKPLGEQKMPENIVRKEHNDNTCQDSKITEEEREEILQLHNKYRSDLANGRVRNKIQQMPNSGNIRKLVSAHFLI